MSQQLFSCPTWADLLTTLQSLTPEQLARPVLAGNEMSSFSDISLRITTEPHYEVDFAEWVPESQALANLDPEDLANCDREEAGTIWLYVD